MSSLNISAQSIAVFQELISGDLKLADYGAESPEYLLAQTFSDVFQERHEEVDNHFDQLALAIQASRKGAFDWSDSLWISIFEADSIWYEEADFIIIRLEYAAHMVRKNHLAAADSVYTSIADGSYDILIKSPSLLAYYYEQQGLSWYAQSRYVQAKRYYEKADSLWVNLAFENHPWRLKHFIHFGLLQTAMGDFAAAETYFEQALSMISLSAERYQLDMADVESGLGNLRRMLGDYQQSLSHFFKAHQVYQSFQMSIDVATVLNNMAHVYDLSDSLDQAIDLYAKALEIYEQQLGTENIAYASILNNIAGLLDYQEKYGEAEEKYLHAGRIFATVLGKKNSRYSTLLSNLGLLYENLGEPQQAKARYLEAIAIRKEVLGSLHPRYVELLYRLAGLYSYLSPEESLQLYEEANAKQIDLLEYYYASFDERTRLEYLEEIKLEFEIYFSTAIRYGSGPAREAMLNFHLSTKGLATRFARDIRKRIKSSSLGTQEMYTAWQSMADSLAQSIVFSEEKRQARNISLNGLIAEVEELEKNYIRSAGQVETTDAKYHTIKEHLSSEEIAIDFVKFEGHKNGSWTDTVWYYAIIIDPLQDFPAIVKIGHESLIKDVVEQGFYPIQYPVQYDALSALIATPLIPYMKAKKKIYFSATGLLHQIPMDALKVGGQFLLDLHDIEMCNDLGELVNEEDDDLPRGGRVLFIGGLDYDGDQSSPESISTFQRIGGSEAEIAAAQKILASSQRSTLEISGRRATRHQVLESLRQNAFQIGHFATHGFAFERPRNLEFSDESLRNRIATSPNDLIRSGLILSGANQYWLKDPEEGESGILTAYDVANLDLSNMNLAVLSACQSGIGQIHSEEGVFGLPRAFKLAGVERVIFTLWPIDDEISAEFFLRFYRHCISGHPIGAAFKKTKLRMKKKYDPFYWAPFVLMQ